MGTIEMEVCDEESVDVERMMMCREFVGGEVFVEKARLPKAERKALLGSSWR